ADATHMSLSTAIATGAVRFIEHSGYRRRQTVAFLVLATATTAAYLSAYVIRFEFGWRSEYTRTFLLTLPLLLVLRYATQLTFRLTTNRWRFVGVPDVIRLA